MNDAGPKGVPAQGNVSLILRAVIALASMAVAANCFLKYIWWAACYSAWSGIPKLTEQWKRAGTRAAFFGWSVLALELASLAVIFSMFRPRSAGGSRNVLRLATALIITIAATALLAGALTWIKQATP
jgi:hypothetical protein